MPETRLNVTTETTETYSDHYLQEMIGTPPGWILRSGTSVIALGVVLLLFLAAFIRYPDKIAAKAIITSERPPVEIVAKVAAPIDTLLVSNNQNVSAQTILAVMEDAASAGDVVRLADFLNELTHLNNAEAFAQVTVSPSLRLGNLGNAYAILLQNLQDLRYVWSQTSIQEQILAIDKEIVHTRQLNQSLRRQEKLLQEEITIVEKDVKRNRQLHATGTISAIDLEEKEKALIQYRRQLESLPASILQNDIRMEQLGVQQAQLRQQREEALTTRLHTLRQQVQSLQAAINTWQQNYLLRATTSGVIAFSPGLTNKKTVQPGEILFTILPTAPLPDLPNNRDKLRRGNSHAGEAERGLLPLGGRSGGGLLLARCQVPTSGIGKVGIGTPVQIALDAYPEKEYGALKATVTEIALVPTTVQSENTTTATYEMIVQLPDTLRTSYQKVIPFRQNMTATATLLTEDKSILERIFENFLDLVKNR